MCSFHLNQDNLWFLVQPATYPAYYSNFCTWCSSSVWAWFASKSASNDCCNFYNICSIYPTYFWSIYSSGFYYSSINSLSIFTSVWTHHSDFDSKACRTTWSKYGCHKSTSIYLSTVPGTVQIRSCYAATSLSVSTVP